MRRCFVPFLLIMGMIACGAAVARAEYHLIKKVPLAGEARWDYVAVDAAGRRVYVSHATQVEVLDADTFEHLGTIPNTPGVHGIAIAREFGRGFISAGKSDSVVMFDLKSLQPLSVVKVGKGPDAILYDPATKHVFAMNADGNSASVIDAASGRLIRTIQLDGNPEFGLADGNGSVYINIEDKAETAHINAKTLTVLHQWPLSPGKTATALAYDPATRRLFAGCRGGHLMVILDADSGRIIGTEPIGDHVDAAAFDPATKLVFMSAGDGTVSVFHQDSSDKYSLVQTVTTGPGSKTMALDPKTHNLFVPARIAGQFMVLVLAR